MVDPRLYWIGLNMVKGIGAVRFKALLDVFGSAESAWNASPEALQSAGLSQKIVASFQRFRKDVDLEQVWERIQSLGVQVLTWEDEAYPSHLKEIDQPPPVLYVRGSLQAEDEWAVAIVGTRKVTAYGRQVAEDVATVLAHSGVTVVSGLARGVDSVAHQAALNAGGRTLAVLGNGVDQVYPPENRKLAAQIMEHGALISDYALGTQPDGVNFPPRNRIISGLSLAVIIVEAGETSGALITATFAAEQGRDVFAVPGNITAPQSKGTNRLIRDGAQPLLNPQDVLEALNLTMVTEHQAARVSLPTDPVEVSLYKLLSQQPMYVDEIRMQAGMPIETVSATLAMMELKGMVRQVGGMNYVAVREETGNYEA
ncbi:MAG: DNA-protecting protein DprA [Anaerolineales bacterium]|nr:DNA-protecting protein DprA [Anaerolineae bacterium]PWB56384.1 MAG: DNA-protecting protein DprA [Anaerolineales bacterium]